MKLVVVGVLLIALCGCATKPFTISDSSRYASAGSAFNGQATVYVMRDLSGVGIKWPVHVELDGAQEGTLRRASYTRFAVTPGRHVIRAHWNHVLTATPDIAINCDFEVGKTYYVAIGTDNGVSGGTLLYGSAMRPVDPRVGAELARKYNDRTPGSHK